MTKEKIAEKIKIIKEKLNDPWIVIEKSARIIDDVDYLYLLERAQKCDELEEWAKNTQTYNLKELEAKCKIYEDALTGMAHRDCSSHGQCAACRANEALEKAKVK